MTDCDKLKQFFSDYLDAELPLEQRKELDDHFKMCLECKETVRQIKIIQQSLSHLPQINTSPEFEQRLHQQIFQADNRSGFLPQPLQNWKLPAMGSAIVLATVGLFLVFNDSPSTDPMPVNSPSSGYSPASPQLPVKNKSEFPSSNNSSGTLGSGTLISDSLDTMQFKSKGLQQVGKK
jgi:hypothetical protein